MKTRDIFKTASSSLSANRSRSLLAILGIIIGITSVMMIVAISEGAQELILSQIRGLGSQVMFVRPGRQPSGPSSFAELFTDSLHIDDVHSLENRGNVPGITNVMPLSIGTFQLNWQSESTRASMIGATNIVEDILDAHTKDGDFFSDEDVKSRSTLVVLGPVVKKHLFGDSDAVGQIIRIKNINFRVAGVLEEKGSVGLFNLDEAVIAPYTTVQQYLTGTDYFQEIVIQVDDEKSIPRIKADVASLLRTNHDISDPAKDDFFITTPEDAVNIISSVTGILKALLTAVAAISLVVGGIGIMNIMIVSVTERTREIGLRKAIGATDGDILRQFLLESVLLTTIGGLIGIFISTVLGFLASVGLSKVLHLNWIYAFPLAAMIISISVAAIAGIVFGLYPARRAARLDPVEALRYE